ncbi:4-hydroxythreonine-4-phosphate dehydrogenase PdxA [Moorella naiadis]|uniref:4-hydroxythreonine-4-phosphate dehydrogenase PdxA n=1 Tax=Moorella naiadis (nom. illeg.) TaxID=3093670 RepID=UPI003D9C8EDD
MYRPLIAISVGDPCGIGPEITAKALAMPKIYEQCRPLAVADTGLMCEAIKIAGVNLGVRSIKSPAEGRYEYGTIDVLDLQNVDLEQLKYGKITQMGGEASFQYIARAIELALSGEVDAVTTGPINKEAINLAGHHYSGHTEIFADMTKTRDYCMMLIDKNFRVSHVTTHIALSQVPSLVKKARVLKVIELTHDALVKMGVATPHIAVAGLNPHAGEDGLFGREEIEEITPAIAAAREQGIQIDGPVPPDTIFVKLQSGQYDAVVAMYHDQGHIPTKVIGFKYNNTTGKWGSVAGINITLGLPIIRTSVDHGTAFGKAGKGTANPESMVDALRMAKVLAES